METFKPCLNSKDRQVECIKGTPFEQKCALHVGLGECIQGQAINALKCHRGLLICKCLFCVREPLGYRIERWHRDRWRYG